MNRINTLFLLLVVLGPLHMIEQILTSIEEFYWLRGRLEHYYAWFAPASADLATVILITVVWTKVSLLFYTVLLGGTPRLVVLVCSASSALRRRITSSRRWPKVATTLESSPPSPTRQSGVSCSLTCGGSCGAESRSNGLIHQAPRW